MPLERIRRRYAAKKPVDKVCRVCKIVVVNQEFGRVCEGCWGGYIPTQEEIAAECAAIRSEWGPVVTMNRKMR